MPNCKPTLRVNRDFGKQEIWQLTCSDICYEFQPEHHTGGLENLNQSLILSLKLLHSYPSSSNTLMIQIRLDLCFDRLDFRDSHSFSSHLVKMDSTETSLWLVSIVCSDGSLLEEHYNISKYRQWKMLYQKKLVKLFKDFFEGTCLPYIRQHSSVLKEWLYFSTMISQQVIDYAKIQKYVEELSAHKKHILTEKSNNVHSFSLSHNKGFTMGSFFMPQNESFRAADKPAFSSSLDYGKNLNFLSSLKSDNYLMKVSEPLKQKQKPSKKPLSKIVANLSGLYEMFSDNQRRFQSKMPQPHMLSQEFANKLI